MAKNKDYGKKNYGNKSSYKSKSRSGLTDDEKLAYKLGKIQASLNNDCRVKDSYEKGKKSLTEEKAKKKPLY